MAGEKGAGEVEPRKEEKGRGVRAGRVTLWRLEVVFWAMVPCWVRM